MLWSQTYICNEELRDQKHCKKLGSFIRICKPIEKIKPVCPYVVKMFERNPDWSYLLANQN